MTDRLISNLCILALIGLFLLAAGGWIFATLLLSGIPL
jgi:hypothetical protein